CKHALLVVVWPPWTSSAFSWHILAAVFAPPLAPIPLPPRVFVYFSLSVSLPARLRQEEIAIRFRLSLSPYQSRSPSQQRPSPSQEAGPRLPQTGSLVQHVTAHS